MRHRRPSEALRLIVPLLNVESYDEEVPRAYMVGASAAGNRGAALHEYRRFAARLRDELSLSPIATDEQLLDRISSGHLLADEVVPDTVPGAEPGPGQGPGSALRPLAFAPPDSPLLIGPALDLADLGRLLSCPACRLLPFTGPGDVGKSRLVRHAALELSRLFGDGRVLTRAETLTSADALLAAVAQAMSLPVASGARPVDAVAGAIGERRFLLILGDLDGVDNATNAVGKLLSHCSFLATLTTSRERLNLTEERVLAIDGLASPKAGTALKEALTFDAVLLFIEREQRARPDYYLA